MGLTAEWPVVAITTPRVTDTMARVFVDQATSEKRKSFHLLKRKSITKRTKSYCASQVFINYLYI